jgi:hypothetical protein
MSQYTIDMIAKRAMTTVESDSSALKDAVAFTGRLACMTPQRNGHETHEVTHCWRAWLAAVG